MALRGACRWKPDAYRSTLSATIQEFDPSATPPTGGVVMTAQAVVYDDTKITPSNYKPGDPSTESNIVVLYEEPIVKDLSLFDDMSQAEAELEWKEALEEFKDRVLPAGEALVKAVYAARVAPPILIG